MAAANGDMKMPASIAPRPQRERRHLYAMLHMWDDEETQVSAPVPMAELVRASEASADESDDDDRDHH